MLLEEGVCIAERSRGPTGRAEGTEPADTSALGLEEQRRAVHIVHPAAGKLPRAKCGPEGGSQLTVSSNQTMWSRLYEGSTFSQRNPYPLLRLEQSGEQPQGSAVGCGPKLSLRTGFPGGFPRTPWQLDPDPGAESWLSSWPVAQP